MVVWLDIEKNIEFNLNQALQKLNILLCFESLMNYPSKILQLLRYVKFAKL